jgi:hypothetical protein
MLPALTPTQTVSVSEGSKSTSPDSRIQWHKYVASPPSTKSTSVFRIHGTQRSAPMVGNAVSSMTPSDAQAGQVPELGFGGYEASHRSWTAHRVTPLCGRDAEGVALRDWLAQQVDQRIVDASVCDTPGSEKKFHDGTPLFLSEILSLLCLLPNLLRYWRCGGRVLCL